MRALLRPEPEGQPDDFLLALIKGRRSFLVNDWERLMHQPAPMATLNAAPWRAGFQEGGAPGWPRLALQHEYAHLFSRMREPLRCVLSPLFWFAEVRAIAITLRNKAVGSETEVDPLRWSLLSRPLRRVLAAPGGIAETVERLTAVLVRHDTAFAALPSLLRSGGTAAAESALFDISLQLRRTPGHPAVERWLTLLIDSANLTAVAKALRWKLPVPSPLLAGGSLRCKRLQVLAAKGDRIGLAQLAAGLAGGSRQGDPDELERTVAAARKRAMQRLAREPDGIGAIIAYLWRCRDEAAALGLLERLNFAGFELVDGEFLP